MSSNKTHRAFRISDDLWNDFTEITQREGITATAAITRFLQTSVLNGSVTWLDDVNTVNTETPLTVKTVDTVPPPDVNTTTRDTVNTSIEIEDVLGLTDVLTKLQQSVNSLLLLRETVLGVREDLAQSQSKVEGLERRFQLETDLLYKQLDLFTAQQASHQSILVEDVSTLTKSESEVVNTNSGIESDNVYTHPPVQSEPTSPHELSDPPTSKPPKKTGRKKNPELANRELATAEMLPEKLAHLAKSYMDMGMLLGDVSKEFRERGIPNPYGLNWSIGDVKKLILE